MYRLWNDYHNLVNIHHLTFYIYLYILCVCVIRTFKIYSPRNFQITIQYVTSHHAEHCGCLYESCLTLQPHGLQPTRLLCPWDFQSRILELVMISYSRGSSQPKNQTLISCISCIGRWILYHQHCLGSSHCTLYPHHFFSDYTPLQIITRY